MLSSPSVYGRDMSPVLVPVRYPLSRHSRRTLERAVELAEERDTTLIVLHVNLYQNGENVTRSQLKRGVERIVGYRPFIRYSIARGFLVEETILEEVASERAETVVIGHKQIGRWRRAFNRLVDDPDVAEYLERRVDCEVVVVKPD